MTHSRRKGTHGEREVELLLQQYGLQTERTLGGRIQLSGDILVHDPALAIEVRRREQLRIVEWCRTHEESTPPSHVPVLVFRPNREPWRVSLRLDDFCSLLGDGAEVVPLREVA